ncbi:DUF4166 domain-containing protein [Litchfieldia alkalitelluris]|uniref:DUF4166 domain-containing protein n=1 Tax=Litchfieldia alkalitelluris TaxID=304268 RepID=UPI000997BFD6|nr:DUF4166 domain-containing protein [Litchfieldia alkalitelluris]
MSIYKKILGDKFNELHPKLQERYEISYDNPFHGKGKMRKIDEGHIWLFPLFYLGVKFKLLFPEHGTNIPFSIKNTYRVGKHGEEQIHWERIFHFRNKKRYFNALMSLDHSRKIIKDYLGEPHLVYSDLSFNVSPQGGLTITSLHQRLVLGRVEIPLPKVFQGIATVKEEYNDENQMYEIIVSVRNPLIGKVFSYEGEFRRNDVS